MTLMILVNVLSTVMMLAGYLVKYVDEDTDDDGGSIMDELK